jgi:hypothetical protein
VSPRMFGLDQEKQTAQLRPSVFITDYALPSSCRPLRKCFSYRVPLQVEPRPQSFVIGVAPPEEGLPVSPAEEGLPVSPAEEGLPGAPPTTRLLHCRLAPGAQAHPPRRREGTRGHAPGEAFC